MSGNQIKGIDWWSVDPFLIFVEFLTVLGTLTLIFVERYLSEFEIENGIQCHFDLERYLSTFCQTGCLNQNAL